MKYIKEYNQIRLDIDSTKMEDSLKEDIQNYLYNVSDELNLEKLDYRTRWHHGPAYSHAVKDFDGILRNTLMVDFMNTDNYNGGYNIKNILTESGLYVAIYILIKREYYNKNKDFVDDVIGEFEDRVSDRMSDTNNDDIVFPGRNWYNSVKVGGGNNIRKSMNSINQDPMIQSFEYDITFIK